MICERPYLSVFPAADLDPETHCYACDGRGFKRWFDADTGFITDRCTACGSVATAGVFVVQVVATRFRYELRYQSSDYTRAVGRAERAAAHFAGRKCLGHTVREGRVVFKPLDASGEREQIVSVAEVTPAGPVAA